MGTRAIEALLVYRAVLPSLSMSASEQGRRLASDSVTYASYIKNKLKFSKGKSFFSSDNCLKGGFNPLWMDLKGDISMEIPNPETAI